MLLRMRLTRLSSCTSWRSFCALYVAASCFAAFFLCSASASRSLAISRIYLCAIYVYMYTCIYLYIDRSIDRSINISIYPPTPNTYTLILSCLQLVTTKSSQVSLYAVMMYL